MAYRRKMESIGEYYYDKKDILGHGAFAIVFKGYKKQVSLLLELDSASAYHVSHSVLAVC
jgi:hypothetical protein